MIDEDKELVLKEFAEKDSLHYTMPERYTVFLNICRYYNYNTVKLKQSLHFNNYQVYTVYIICTSNVYLETVLLRNRYGLNVNYAVNQRRCIV